MARRILSWLRWTLGIVVLLGILVQVYFFAHLYWLRDHNPNMTTFMDARLAKMREIKPDAKLGFVWVPYEKISDHLKRAILTSEDDKFVDHDGFDWEGIQKAIE